MCMMLAFGPAFCPKTGGDDADDACFRVACNLKHEAAMLLNGAHQAMLKLRNMSTQKHETARKCSLTPCGSTLKKPG